VTGQLALHAVSLRMVNTSVARLGTLRREQWRDTKHTYQCSTQACKLMCICTHGKCASCLGLLGCCRIRCTRGRSPGAPAVPGGNLPLADQPAVRAGGRAVWRAPAAGIGRRVRSCCCCCCYSLHWRGLRTASEMLRLGRSPPALLSVRFPSASLFRCLPGLCCPCLCLSQQPVLALL
jgi:hypothetical protein